MPTLAEEQAAMRRRWSNGPPVPTRRGRPKGSPTRAGVARYEASILRQLLAEQLNYQNVSREVLPPLKQVIRERDKAWPRPTRGTASIQRARAAYLRRRERYTKSKPTVHQGNTN